MEIKGLGSEIVECARIGKMIKQHGELFLTRVYSEKELLFCSVLDWKFGNEKCFNS